MTDTVPTHVGLILDGNRRWAAQHHKMIKDGHKKGATVFKDISLELFNRGVTYVTGYIFSIENWQRKAEEIDFIMRLVLKAVEMHLEEFHARGIRIRILGERSSLSRDVIKAIETTEKKTFHNHKATLALCFNYGGKQEIVNATKQLIDSGVSSAKVNEQLFSQHLYAPDIPDIDVLVRTSGEKRLSGFMLWRAAYAELLFIEKNWPDMRSSDVDMIVQTYSERQRRFGC